MILTDKNSFRIGRAFMLAVAVLIVTSAFAAEEKKEAKPKADDVKSEAKSDAKTVDPFVVPEGSPDELIAYLKKIGEMRPESQDMSSVLAFIKKSRIAMVEAAEKIMVAPKVTDDQFKLAASAKFQGLMTLLQVRDPKAMELLEAFPAQLRKLNRPELAKGVEGQLLGIEFAKAIRGVPGAKPLHEVVEQFNAFLGEKPEPASLELIIRIASQLGQVDKKEAIDFCQRYSKLFASNDDPAVMDQVKYLEGTARRLGLVGKPIKIVGKTLDGAEFDWAAYKGKVTLIQFWATWCQPCREEIPGLLADYQKYHDKGFDVVGINMDRGVGPVEEYLKQEPLPWTIIYNGPREEGETETVFPNVAYYGVIGIPELILVGRDGKVIATGIRGPALALELETLLGTKDEKKQASN